MSAPLILATGLALGGLYIYTEPTEADKRFAAAKARSDALIAATYAKRDALVADWNLNHRPVIQLSNAAYKHSDGTEADYKLKLNDETHQRALRLQALAWSRSNPIDHADYGTKLKEVYTEAFGKKW